MTDPLFDLIRDCDARGIRLYPNSAGTGLTINAPENGLTPELRERLKAAKADLLSFLITVANHSTSNPIDAGTLWAGAVDELTDIVSPEVLDGLRAADPNWESNSG